jgi:hypothetical protein
MVITPRPTTELADGPSILPPKTARKNMQLATFCVASLHKARCRVACQRRANRAGAKELDRYSYRIWIAAAIVGLRAIEAVTLVYVLPLIRFTLTAVDILSLSATRLLIGSFMDTTIQNGDYNSEMLRSGANWRLPPPSGF